MRRSIASAIALVWPSRNWRSSTCASCAACQSVASRSAIANRRASLPALSIATDRMCDTATHDVLPITPRPSTPAGPAQTIVCTMRNAMPSHANMWRRRVEVIVISAPLAATYQVA